MKRWVSNVVEERRGGRRKKQEHKKSSGKAISSGRKKLGAQQCMDTMVMGNDINVVA